MPENAGKPYLVGGSGTIFQPREAEKDYLFSNLVIVGFLITMMSVVMAMSQEAGLRYGVIKLSPALASGIVSQATVNEAGIHEVTYEYEDRSGRLHIGQMLLYEPGYRSGEVIDVAYFTYHPEIFHPKRELDREGLIFVVFVGSVLLLSALIWQFWRSFASVRRFESAGRNY